MHFVSSLFILFICAELSTQQISMVSASSSSLWGEKLHFTSAPCLWQLGPDTVVPALEELSVCLLLKCAYSTEWTAFVYKAPDSSHIELGRSHFVMDKRVEAEHGKSLIGDISHFRIWSKHLSGDEVQRHQCIDGDVIGWDQRHLKSDCPPVHDPNLSCYWSRYKIKMKVQYQYIDEMYSDKLLENATKQWLENLFPGNFSLTDIVLSSSHSCSTDISYSLSSACFLVKVFVNVVPAADVGLAQADITARLSSPLDFLNATVDPDSVVVLSVDLYPAVTSRPSTVNTASTEGVAPTQSMPAIHTNTTESVEINKTFYGADIFFRVHLDLGISGSLTNPLIFIKTLIKENLNYSNTMKALNFLISETAASVQSSGLLAAIAQQKEYTCSFHVQEDYTNAEANVTLVLNYIEKSLNFSFSNESISVRTISLKVKHIEPQDCMEEKTSSIYGNYIWPQTFPQENQTIRCQRPPQEYAFRLCKLEISTDTTEWAKPDMRNCKSRVSIPQIENITVTPDNAAEVVETIQDLVNVQLSNSSLLSPEDLDIVVGKLSEVVDVGSNPELGASIISIMGSILVSDTNVTALSNGVLDLTSKMGDTMDFKGTAESITAPSLAISLCNVETEGFSGLTFGVTAVSTNLEPQVFIDETFVSDEIEHTEASISLPPEVQIFFSQDKNTTRLQFQFYVTDKLFQDPILADSKRRLNSYIVSASLNDSSVQNLQERIVIYLNHKKATQSNEEVHCAFWDFQNNGGRGGWNLTGCETRSISHHQTCCLCEHLTHFAVLVNPSRSPISEVDSLILTVISYIGCGISSIFLGITLLTYVAFEKLRRDNPSKILLNLCAALLGLCMLFLLDAWLSSFSSYSLCIATAATLHYFLLASFTWMGLEALHMYLALVKVFNIYVPSYILKFCAVGWGLPLVIVSLVLAVDKDSYGGSVTQESGVVLQTNDTFCWVTNDIVFYVTVLCFMLLILLANLSVFIVVLIQIKRMRINKASANTGNLVKDLRAVASLTVLLGLTWSIGFFSFGPAGVAMMYLFTILNTLQGFFVFLFHCLMKDNVRKQWKIHLCCGRFRLGAYSDWSQTVTGGQQTKKRHLCSDGRALWTLPSYFFNRSFSPCWQTVGLLSSSIQSGFEADDPMEDPTENPTAVKVEEHTQSVILTYFHGDISTMVDAHFSRALSKASKAKAPASKMKKMQKKIKKEMNSAFEDPPADLYPEPMTRPVPEHFVSFNPAELNSPWHAFASRKEGLALPHMSCPLSPGLSLTGQQCSTSLLNLLHTDRPDMAPSLPPNLPPTSKAELHPNWMFPQVDPSNVFEQGRRLDKKDLYWY
uniref:Uncharacterized protein n=1 Tax=Knipowitschia caucasica TaxID=637954 RepID=A0AAV2MJX8_KNICA